MTGGRSASEPVRLGWPGRLMLGSRSPRRLELLRQIHPAELIEVVPPTSTAEAGFENLHDWPSIERRLLEIAHTKCEDVAAQVRSNVGIRARSCNSDGGTPSPPAPLPQGERGEIGLALAPFEQRDVSRKSSPLSPRGRGAEGEGAHGDLKGPVVIAADTVVIVDRGGELHVLGQPPDEVSWQETVRRWFHEDFAGKTHVVATALILEHVDNGKRVSRVVTSQVTFANDVDRWLDWYLSTGESRGKAGGYALQGAGSIFVAKVDGSLSNVVGLPLIELLELLAKL
jgi:predicted house-cleaning NTP pyrophosphatase (Maf/HAM1 superfamily)